MKPWEETWNACTEHPFKGHVAIGDNGIGEFYDPERAKLAAQAPAMARLLIDLFSMLEAHSGPDLQITQVLRDAGVLP